MNKNRSLLSVDQTKSHENNPTMPNTIQILQLYYFEKDVVCDVIDPSRVSGAAAPNNQIIEWI